jgi:phosphatidylinositol-4-phosphate 3-kinase
VVEHGHDGGNDRDKTGLKMFAGLCGAAFNTLRRNAHIVANLLSLMLQSGLKELQSEADVDYVVKHLHLSLSDSEADALFSELITKSLRARSTQVNFYIHNLANKGKGKKKEKSRARR